MEIKREIYEAIVSYPAETPPEVGGIIGSREWPVIDMFVGDPGKKGPFGCSYVPDTTFLNETIRQWLQEGILFQGIAHAHFHGVRTLSDGDRAYIRRIIEAMPAQIKSLYFPIIVLPERELVPYKAELADGELVIVEDLLKVV
ncbi:MAG: hypothetical protein IKE58_06300 [Blautia sp.]|nr:hypothetical protein [Blautia sp.]